MYDHLVARGAFSSTCCAKVKPNYAGRFRRPRARSGFGSWREDEDGLPYLTDSQVSIFCRVGPSMSFASHTMFVGEVVKIIVDDAISPLVYLDGRYFAARPAP